MVDPSSIMTADERRAASSMPMKTRSETTVSHRTPPDLVPDTSSGDDSDEEDDTTLTMSPAELRVIRRLSGRVNILPVIARADSLTDEKLGAVKEAGELQRVSNLNQKLTGFRPVRTGLAEAGIDFGVFGSSKKVDPHATPKRQTQFSVPDHERNGHRHANGDSSEAPEDGDSDAEDADTERRSRQVIKLRPSRHRGLSRSRSRRDLSQVAAEDIRRPVSPEAESVANVRFSAHIVAKTDLSTLMPFALIAPEPHKHRPRPNSSATDATDAPSSPGAHGVEEEAPFTPTDGVPPTPASTHSHSRNFPFLQGPGADDLKGVFTRSFRWGTIDVLDPNHCDFAALRTAVLSTHLKVGNPPYQP